MAKKTCGKCKHWQRAAPYKWGYCGAELPAWVHDDESPTIFPSDELAVNCDLYYEIEDADDDKERARENITENRIAQEIDERREDARPE